MNCSGNNAYRHGTMKDWVVSMTVVLADGAIVKTRRRPRKSSAGYDLTRLMVGSEGTLGLVTEAVLKVTSAPENLQAAQILEEYSKVMGGGVCVIGRMKKDCSSRSDCTAKDSISVRLSFSPCSVDDPGRFGS